MRYHFEFKENFHPLKWSSAVEKVCIVVKVYQLKIRGIKVYSLQLKTIDDKLDVGVSKPAKCINMAVSILGGFSLNLFAAGTGMGLTKSATESVSTFLV